jgi:uncharacterized protein YxeA
MYKSKIVLAVSAIILTISGVTLAADDAVTDAKLPLVQAKESVNKNLKRDPDSKGLNNASSHLETNQTKVEAHKIRKAEKHLAKDKNEELKKATKVAEHNEKASEESNETADKDEHSSNVENSEKAEHAEKVSRPERNQRTERANSNRK